MENIKQNQSRTIIFITILIAFVIICTLLFKSNGILQQNEVLGDTKEVKVAILTSDVITDQSWGSLAYKGKLKILEKFPANVELLSEINTEELMEDSVLSQIEQGASIIIGHGREFSDVFTKVSPNYPEVKFVTVHGEATYSNQAVYTFHQGDIEYFAALAASLKTKTKKIGILEPTDTSKKNPEFGLALSFYLPEATLFYEVVGSRDDGTKALKQLDNLLAKGVDVVYTKGNSYNQDVIHYAKEKGVMVIGYLDNQSYMAKNVVLTSVVNDVSEVYVSIMEDFFSDDGIPSGKVMLNRSDGVYELSPFGPMFTNEEIRYIKSEMKKFDKGERTFQ